MTSNEILFLIAVAVVIVVISLYLKYRQPQSFLLANENVAYKANVDFTEYRIRNGTLYSLYIYNSNNVLLGSMGGWSPYSLEVQKSDFPLLATYCDVLLPYDKCKNHGDMGVVIKEPGCYVVWYIDYYYTTSEVCSNRYPTCYENCDDRYEFCEKSCIRGEEDECDRECNEDRKKCYNYCRSIG